MKREEKINEIMFLKVSVPSSGGNYVITEGTWGIVTKRRQIRIESSPKSHIMFHKRHNYILGKTKKPDKVRIEKCFVDLWYPGHSGFVKKKVSLKQ